MKSDNNHKLFHHLLLISLEYVEKSVYSNKGPPYFRTRC